MQFRDTPEQAAFREDVRRFIELELPPVLRSKPLLGYGVEARASEERREALAEWRKKLHERGWLAPLWPKEYSGSGMSVMGSFVLNEELARAGAPSVGGPGTTIIGPTIIMHGSEQQKESFLPPTLSGEISWCQGFSEPGAGSDLASLQTRAVGDGDDFLINGHKTWISGAHQASWMYMLARTDPDAPKHKGITYFLVDMKSPGLTTRPIVNIVGESGFDDVFFDGVRVPRENIVGEINRGWYVATTTLDFERSAIGLAIGVEQSVEDLIRYVRENPELTIGRNPRLRHSLADRWIESQVAILFSYRIFTMQNRGLIPNQEASAQKLYTSELTQRITRTAMETLGLHGPLFGDRAPLEGRWARSYLGTTSSTIAGGTSEIQRNIIALRGLGLPRG